MAHPAETTLARTLAALRQTTLSGPAEPDKRLVEGLYISWEAEANVTLTLDSPAEQGLTLSAKMERAPGWFGLNLDLGAVAFAPGSLLGIVLDLTGRLDRGRMPFIRSGLKGSREDTMLDETIPEDVSSGVTVLMHDVFADSVLTHEAAFHTLVLPMPLQSFELTLADLRIFVLPPERVQTLRRVTLATAAH